MNYHLAVDIALLPPDVESEKIINLVEHFDDKPTKLNSVDCLPHITLAMGVIKKTKLETAFQIIDALSKNMGEIPISIQRADITTLPNHVKISELIVEPSPDILKLHMDVMDAFRDLLTNDNVRLDYFISPPEVSTQSIYWVQNYFKHHQSVDDYRPHITLGEGILKNLPNQIRFNASTLTLCHLGTYCTCRKILF